MIRLLIAAAFIFGGGYLVLIGIGEQDIRITLAGVAASASGVVLVIRGGGD